MAIRAPHREPRTRLRSVSTRPRQLWGNRSRQARRPSRRVSWSCADSINSDSRRRCGMMPVLSQYRLHIT